ncbi:hypothetical protein [Pedobacter miscanthi]|uniref:Uncharacterized protein n=1 Tax=Pedobacter miscanthi TaxID=2259170 RepID=A0A366LC16_9SPHI|nr:hypothetical protein [Pedobacter miscanthi]RBQ11428.1 hypothetical protein DRW42_02905 [Pedobacter miscanthi]
MVEKYTPAGHASASSVITTLVIGIVASLLLPLFYIILSQLIPNIWFIAICAFLLGMALGLMINLGIKIGKIRNFRIAVVIAIVCSLLAFYVQWVFFDAVMYSRRGFTFNQSSTDLKQLILDMGFLFVHPGILFKEIVALNEVGTFRIQGSSNISGILLWVIWLGEFLVIIGGTVFVVGNGQVKLPYSELNDQWMKPRKPSSVIPFVEDKEHLINQLNNRNFDILKNNPEVLREAEYGEVVIYEAMGDPTKYISVMNVTAPSGKNKQARKKKVLSHYPIQNNPSI